MKNLLPAILLFLFIDSNAKNTFSIGYNFHVEQMNFNTIEYSTLNSKNSLEGYFNGELIGIGTGFSICNEDYTLQNDYRGAELLNFKSHNLGFLLNAYFNFTKSTNTVFLDFENEFIYTTSATRIDYGYNGRSTAIRNLNKWTFNRWQLSFGIGYKFHVIEKFKMKSVVYYSVNDNVNSGEILSLKPEFYKIGFSIGILRDF